MSHSTPLQYLSGFGNEHQSEAIANTLPVGQFSPQQVRHGLYAEKFSSTAFTAPRHRNRRNWLYRIRPSVTHEDFHAIENGLIRTAPVTEIATPPNPLRWDPLEIPAEPQDFVASLVTLAANGNAATQIGMGVHLYLANQSMHDRFFCNADGELLLVPQRGNLLVHTECGIVHISPGEICVLPRGMTFRVELPDGAARGYICENYGSPLELPERGPVGSDGFANARDFMAPVAAFEDRDGEFELLCKFNGAMYSADIDHSPLDVVGWIGNSYPYKYDLARFNTINTVSYDHPDPSIFTVLTSASDTPGVANIDFVIFPPRWMVAENTFRPPWYHRNVMSEFMGLIKGVYDAKSEGFAPGGASLHNCMAGHGPDATVFAAASSAQLQPQKLQDTLAFMFESRYVIQTTKYALESSARQRDYARCWQSIEKQFPGRS